MYWVCVGALIKKLHEYKLAAEGCEVSIVLRSFGKVVNDFKVPSINAPSPWELLPLGDPVVVLCWFGVSLGWSS